MGAYFDRDKWKITVWAPLHEKIFYHPLAGREVQMEKEGDYFSAELQGVKSGDLYWLNVDGKLFPDPLSRFQPRGVDGPSMLIDTTKFEWSSYHRETQSTEDTVLYEVHIGTFTRKGTYRDAENRIAYLKDLGVDALEIMPLSQSYGSRNWGYDGVFPFAPAYSYGSPSDLAHFIDKCHLAGLSCLLDVVYNHMGPIGNVFPSLAPYFSKKYSTPWGEAINLDGPYSNGVREMYLSNLSYWVEEYHFDGFRFDSTQNIYDSSPKHFLSELTDHAAALSTKLDSKILMIAESDKNDANIVRAKDACGMGFDCVWADDLHHSFHSYITGEKNGYYSDYGNLSDIAYTIEHGFLFDGKYSKYLKNNRGTHFSGENPSSLVVALQNHDQIGNRRLAERISTLASFEEIKLGASVFILTPFTPMIFMGEEYGETSPFWFFMQSDDKEFAKKVDFGRRSEFKDFNWQGKIIDPSSEEAFMQSKLKWNFDSRNRQMLSLYKDLILIRKRYLKKPVRNNYNVSIDGSVIKIVYEPTGITVTHNFGSEGIKVQGEVLLNTSCTKYGGQNMDLGTIEEPGSIVHTSVHN
ncbi:MAG: malto-oligosyltrehalose trehalohydrolase [Candidatus Thermoplasmatota archaeon]|nr:malto-oligosyltrehalose trehalohydrolase [Candidatus Thermoplasmatota archaeon]